VNRKNIQEIADILQVVKAITISRLQYNKRILEQIVEITAIEELPLVAELMAKMIEMHMQKVEKKLSTEDYKFLFNVLFHNAKLDYCSYGKCLELILALENKLNIYVSIKPESVFCQYECIDLFKEYLELCFLSDYCLARVNSVAYKKGFESHGIINDAEKLEFSELFHWRIIKTHLFIAFFSEADYLPSMNYFQKTYNYNGREMLACDLEISLPCNVEKFASKNSPELLDMFYNRKSEYEILVNKLHKCAYDDVLARIRKKVNLEAQGISIKRIELEKTINNEIAIVVSENWELRDLSWQQDVLDGLIDIFFVCMHIAFEYRDRTKPKVINPEKIVQSLEEEESFNAASIREDESCFFSKIMAAEAVLRIEISNYTRCLQLAQLPISSHGNKSTIYFLTKIFEYYLAYISGRENAGDVVPEFDDILLQKILIVLGCKIIKQANGFHRKFTCQNYHSLQVVELHSGNKYMREHVINCLGDFLHRSGLFAKYLRSTVDILPPYDYEQFRTLAAASLLPKELSGFLPAAAAESPAAPKSAKSMLEFRCK
jgi:hypothetical protein